MREWHECRLGEVASMLRRGTAPAYVSMSTVRAIGQRCVRNEGFDVAAARPHDARAGAVVRPECGDVLINSTGTGTIGRSCVFPCERGDFMVDGHVTLVRPAASELDGRFLNELVRSPGGQRFLESHCFAGSTNQIELSCTQLSQMPVVVPPLDEQRRIAEILDTIDETIQVAERVIAKRQLLRTALIREQTLPNSGVRDRRTLPAGWIDVRIGDALQQHVERVRIDDHQSYDLISIRRRHGGMFHRERHAGSEILGKNMQRVIPGTFVIARRQIVHGACAIATPEFAHSIMSMSYSAFVGTPICDIRYFFALAQTPPMVRRFWDASHGVVVEKLNFQQEEWLGYRVQLPPMEVQREIVDAVNASEAEITALSQELEAIRGVRIALAVDLLSGRVRTVAA